MVKMDYVWDRTVGFLSDNLSAVLPFALAGLFVPTSIMNALSPLWADAGTGQKGALAAAIVALVLVMMWGSLAITALAVGPDAQPGVGGRAVRRLPAMLGVYAVLVVVAVVLLLPLGLLSVVAGMDVTAMQAGRPMQLASPAAGAGFLLYFFLFLVVMLVASARLMPLGAVVMSERRGIGALARTWRLTRGMTWRLIGVTILYAVVSWVAGLAARTVFGTLLRVIGGGEGPVSVGAVITGVIVAAVSAGFSTLAAVFCAKLYLAVQQTPQPVAVAA